MFFGCLLIFFKISFANFFENYFRNTIIIIIVNIGTPKTVKTVHSVSWKSLRRNYYELQQL